MIFEKFSSLWNSMAKTWYILLA